MTKKVLVALGFVAAIIILLLLYFFSTRDQQFKGPEPPQKPAEKSRITPEPKEKPAPAPVPAPTTPPPPAPAPQEPPQPLPTPPVTPPEKPATKAEAPPPTPQDTELPPPEATEKYGFLAGSYRKFTDAAKKMEKLKKQGLPAFIRRDKGRYQVWAGPFSSRQEARKAAEAIKGKTRRPPKIQKLQIPVPK